MYFCQFCSFTGAGRGPVRVQLQGCSAWSQSETFSLFSTMKFCKIGLKTIILSAVKRFVCLTPSNMQKTFLSPFLQTSRLALRSFKQISLHPLSTLSGPLVFLYNCLTCSPRWGSQKQASEAPERWHLGSCCAVNVVLVSRQLVPSLSLWTTVGLTMPRSLQQELNLLVCRSQTNSGGESAAL